MNKKEILLFLAIPLSIICSAINLYYVTTTKNYLIGTGLIMINMAALIFGIGYMLNRKNHDS